MSFGLLVFGRYLQNVRLAALDLDINKGDGLSSPKVQKEEYTHSLPPVYGRDWIKPRWGLRSLDYLFLVCLALA